MKNLLKSFVILVVLLSSSLMFGQEGHISGTIIDNEFSEPLAFAHIEVKGTTIATTSNFDGIYELELKPGIYTLVFNFAGYRSKEIDEVEIKEGHDINLDITMTVRSLSTRAMTSSAKRN